MKRFLFLLGLCVVLAAALLADVLPPGTYTIPEQDGGYSLFVPTVNAHRMLVALHGSGERSAGYIQNWIPEAARENYLVLAIDSLDPRGWSGADIPRILDWTQTYQKLYEIHSTLLEGASAGAQMALYLGTKFYGVYDGVALFMGVLAGSFAEILELQPLPKNRRPIFMVHGAKDAMIPIQYGRLSAKVLKEKGYDVTFVEEKNMIHQHYRPDNLKILHWFQRKAIR
jgi:predicted esterase